MAPEPAPLPPRRVGRNPRCPGGRLKAAEEGGPPLRSLWEATLNTAGGWHVAKDCPLPEHGGRKRVEDTVTNVAHVSTHWLKSQMVHCAWVSGLRL